jgi:hypothetical protein
MKNCILFVGSLFLVLCFTAAIFLAYALSSVGANTKISRSAPSKSDILSLINDEGTRQVFDSLRFESAEDNGFMDSLIESNWCGASTATVESLFTNGGFKKISAEEFALKMSRPLKQDFDLYGWRPYLAGDMGLSIKSQSDCIKLLVVEIL